MQNRTLGSQLAAQHTGSCSSDKAAEVARRLTHRQGTQARQLDSESLRAGKTKSRARSHIPRPVFCDSNQGPSADRALGGLQRNALQPLSGFDALNPKPSTLIRRPPLTHAGLAAHRRGRPSTARGRGPAQAKPAVGAAAAPAQPAEPQGGPAPSAPRRPAGPPRQGRPLRPKRRRSHRHTGRKLRRCGCLSVCLSVCLLSVCDDLQPQRDDILQPALDAVTKRGNRKPPSLAGTLMHASAMRDPRKRNATTNAQRCVHRCTCTRYRNRTVCVDLSVCACMPHPLSA
jgi:hypothetical protein